MIFPKKTRADWRAAVPIVAGLFTVTYAVVNGFAQGAAENKAATDVLTVVTDHPDALYHQGETVKFTLRLQPAVTPAAAAPVAAAPAPAVKWTLVKDGLPLGQEGTATLQNGEAVVTGKLDEPGFIQCRATCTANGVDLKAVAGAGIDPLQVKPSAPAPDDFDAFWAEKKKQLAAVPINARLTPVESKVEGIKAFDLQADCIGAPVSAYFARPAKAAPKSLPAILTLHGAGVRTSSLALVVDHAKDNMLAIDLNAHGIPNGQSAKFYRDLLNGKLKGYSHFGRESRETSYFLGMYLRVIRALDFLTAQPEWDGRTLITYGTSQGGAQSIAAAGLDPRVSFFVAGVPAMCDHTGMLAGRISGWPKMVPNENGKPDPKILEASRYFDSVNFARRIKAPGCFTVGFIDTTCPPTSVYAAYNAVTSKKQIYNDIPTGHANSPQAKRFMNRAVAAHVAEQKKRP